MEQNAIALGDGLYRLTRDELAALAQSLCRQLAERGSYHGGIRPDNIGCDRQGAVSLGADVGKDVNREWTPAELEYMAPEVFWSGTRNLSADVYSLGMLLYAGVNGGQLPFYPKNAGPADKAEALRRRMSGEALPMPKTAGKHLGQVIDKATQFRADDRYESPQAFDEALGAAREAIKNYVAPAREMFDKPVQELSEMEKLLLAVLTEKAEAQRQAEEAARAAEEAARLEEERKAAEEAARIEAERKAAEEAARLEAARIAAEEAAARGEAPPEAEPEDAPEPPVPDEPEAETPPPEPEEPKPEDPRTIKKPGVDPALVEAISASVAARISQPDPKVKDTPTVPADRQREEAERITRQLEQMDWIGHNGGGKSNHSGWIVLLLCITALVLAALILHSLGAIGGGRRESPPPVLTPYESVEPTGAVESAEPTATPEPTPTPEPTATPEPKPTYQVVLSNDSWEQAKANAEAKGGHLAVVRSAEELQQITDLAAAQGAKYVWIGLSRNESGEMVWVQDNPTPYVVWAPGEPSVRDSYTGQPENYVLLANNAGTWTFNDIGNDPAGAYPRFYSGLLAYVIQYD